MTECYDEKNFAAWHRDVPIKLGHLLSPNELKRWAQEHPEIDMITKAMYPDEGTRTNGETSEEIGREIMEGLKGSSKSEGQKDAQPLFHAGISS